MTIYLYVNAALYAIFAIWITLQHATTSSNLGYETLSNSGRSEYLTVYGGLELGLAAFFAYTAMNSQYARLGLLFALCLYVPIVAYRIVTVAKFWPVKPMTLYVGGLEAVLLIVGVVLWMRTAASS